MFISQMTVQLNTFKKHIPGVVFNIFAYGALALICLQLIMDQGGFGVLTSCFFIYFFPNRTTSYCVLAGFLFGRFSWRLF